MLLDPIAEGDADVGGEARHGPAPEEDMHLQPDIAEVVTDPMIQADQNQIMEAAQEQTQEVGQTLLMKAAHHTEVEETHDPALGAAQRSIAPEAKDFSVETNEQHTPATEHTLDVEPATDGLKERKVPVLSTRPPKVSR